MKLRVRLCPWIRSVLAPIACVAAEGAPRRAQAGGFRYLVLETAGAAPDAELPMLVGLHDSAEVDAMVRRLAGFVAATRIRHPTRGRPVVMGVSYGGDLALLPALRHPEGFAAAFRVAARLLPAWMPRRTACASSCPRIHALHGDADAVVPMAPTANALRQLHSMGFDATLAPNPGVAHDFDPAMQRDFRRQAGALLPTGHARGRLRSCRPARSRQSLPSPTRKA